jgi:septin family protein
MHPGTAGNGHDTHLHGGNIRGYTLMVAGQRTGKTSFLRLLLDTSDISPTANKDQLASVAKFVQGCSGHTSHIRSASINIDLVIDQNTPPQVLALTLLDTPSLDFADEPSADRNIQDIIRQVDARFAEGIDDVSLFSSPSTLFLSSSTSPSGMEGTVG